MNDTETPIDRVPLSSLFGPRASLPVPEGEPFGLPKMDLPKIPGLDESSKAEEKPSSETVATDHPPAPQPRWVKEALWKLFQPSRKKGTALAATGGVVLGAVILNAFFSGTGRGPAIPSAKADQSVVARGQHEQQPQQPEVVPLVTIPTGATPSSPSIPHIPTVPSVITPPSPSIPTNRQPNVEVVPPSVGSNNLNELVIAPPGTSNNKPPVPDLKNLTVPSVDINSGLGGGVARSGPGNIAAPNLDNIAGSNPNANSNTALNMPDPTKPNPINIPAPTGIPEIGRTSIPEFGKPNIPGPKDNEFQIGNTIIPTAANLKIDPPAAPVSAPSGPSAPVIPTLPGGPTIPNIPSPSAPTPSPAIPSPSAPVPAPAIPSPSAPIPGPTIPAPGPIGNPAIPEAAKIEPKGPPGTPATSPKSDVPFPAIPVGGTNSDTVKPAEPVGKPNIEAPVTLPGGLGGNNNPSSAPPPFKESTTPEIPGSNPAPGAGPAPGNLTLVKPMGNTNVQPMNNAEPPRTGFDVDLYQPKQQDTYASLSRQYFGDERYAAALQEFNGRQGLNQLPEVKIPPMHILRKRYPQLIGSSRAPNEGFRDSGTGTNWNATRPSTPAATYTVSRDGVTMHDVADELYGDWRKWKDLSDLNPRLDPNKLAKGVKLELPSHLQVKKP